MAYKLIDVTLTLDTSIYADGDVLADTQEIENVVLSTLSLRRYVLLESIELLDEDDQGVALDLIFLSSSASIGTENSAPSITDANAREILAIFNVATGDYKDLGGCKVATKSNINHVLKTATGSRSIYVAAITRGGTPTYTSSGIRLRVGIKSD